MAARRGLTLVELLVVVAITGTLIAVLFPRFRRSAVATVSGAVRLRRRARQLPRGRHPPGHLPCSRASSTAGKRSTRTESGQSDGPIEWREACEASPRQNVVAGGVCPVRSS